MSWLRAARRSIARECRGVRCDRIRAAAHAAAVVAVAAEPAALRVRVLPRGRGAAVANGVGRRLRRAVRGRGLAAARVAAAERRVSLLDAAARSRGVAPRRVQMSGARQAVFATKWFRVVAEPQPGGDPYYMLGLADYVSVVALAERDALSRAADGAVDHALNLAPLFLAVASGRLSFPGDTV